MTTGQPLLHFTQDRDGFMDLLRRMRRERTQLQCELAIRPRDRGTLRAAVTLMPRSPGNTTEWLWFVAPIPSERGGEEPSSAAREVGKDQASWSQP